MQSDRRKLWLDLWKQLEESTPARRTPVPGVRTRRGSAAVPSVVRMTQSGNGGAGAGTADGNGESSLAMKKNLSRGYLAANEYAVEKVRADVPQDPKDARWRTFVQNDTITGILIGVWDNVTGPRVEHAWVNAKEDPKAKAAMEAAAMAAINSEKENEQRQEEEEEENNSTNSNTTD